MWLKSHTFGTPELIQNFIFPTQISFVYQKKPHSAHLPLHFLQLTSLSFFTRQRVQEEQQKKAGRREWLPVVLRSFLALAVIFWLLLVSPLTSDLFLFESVFLSDCCFM
jgi:hypothetical protein